MPTPALLAVAALTGAATLSSRTQAGSRARKMTAAQAAAHKARLAEMLRQGRWKDALELNKAKGREALDLGGADLTNANLLHALLGRADLSGADLTGADLTDAILRKANLRNASLTNANLSGAWLFGADLTNANLADADLEGASIPDGFLVSGTRLDAVPWKGTPSGWKAVASPRGARFIPASKA